jgi:hypothetical protein
MSDKLLKRIRINRTVDDPDTGAVRRVTGGPSPRTVQRQVLELCLGVQPSKRDCACRGTFGWAMCLMHTLHLQMDHWQHLGSRRYLQPDRMISKESYYQMGARGNPMTVSVCSATAAAATASSAVQG